MREIDERRFTFTSVSTSERRVCSHVRRRESTTEPSSSVLECAPRMPALGRIARVFALFALFLAVGCGAPPPQEPPGRSCSSGKAVIVVRHAEKASTEKDAPLSERGQARARTLASMLGNARVTRLVATQYQRTQQTLAPLAARLALPVELRSADDPGALVSELRAGPDGSVTVVASHSNVVPRLVRDLGGAKLRGVAGDSLPDDDYARVFVITMPCPPAPPVVLELSSDVP
jgi:phosphohistidine phosphatase SixA